MVEWILPPGQFPPGSLPDQFPGTHPPRGAARERFRSLAGTGRPPTSALLETVNEATPSTGSSNRFESQRVEIEQLPFLRQSPRLDDGSEATAVRLLEAFIRQVEALVRAGKLSAEEGQALIDAANEVIG